MVLIDFIYNLSLMVALSIVSGSFDKRYSSNTLLGKIVQGALFGIVAIVGMLQPLIFSQGLIFDGRSVILSIAALFFGPVSGSIAGIIAIIFRIALRGQGIVPGTLVIISSVIIGTIFYFNRKRNDKEFTIRRLIYFGFVVHIVMLLMMFSLPFPIAISVIKYIGIPVILIYPLATVLIGKTLSDQEINIRNLESIKASEVKFRTFFENSMDAILLRIPDGRILAANSAACIIFGYTEQELINIDRSGIVNIADPNLSTMLSERALKGKVQSELTLIRKDGTYFPAEISSTIFKDHQGNERTHMIIRDITDRNHAQEALRKSEERFRSLYENSTIGLYRTTPDGKILLANPTLVKMIGYSSFEELATRDPEKDGFEFTSKRKQFIESIETDGEVKGFESAWIRKDGGVVYIIESAKAIHDSNGKTLYYDGTVEDITETKIAKKLLQESEEKYRLIVENSHDGIEITQDDLIIYSNTQFAEMLGYSLEELKGMRFNLILSERALSELYERQRKRRDGELEFSNQYETTFVKKDGAIIYVGVKYEIIEYHGKPATFATVQDITNRKQAEEALRDSEYHLHALVRTIPDLVWLKDPDGMYLSCNPIFERLYGVSEANIIGKTDYDFVDRELAEFFREHDRKVMEAAKPIINEEWLTFADDGHKAYTETIKTPMYDAQGNLIGVLGIGRDITERKRTDLERQVMYEITHGVTTTSNLDELLKLIHQSISKVVYAENFFITLHDKNTDLYNFPYFVDKFDPTPDPVAMDKSCTAYVFRTEKPLLVMQELFDQLKEQNEVELIGSPSPSWIGVPLTVPSGTIGVLVLQHYEEKDVYSKRDVEFLNTVGSQIASAIVRKQTEEEIKMRNEQLIKINAEKDKFFSIIAHDLRSPFSGFMNLTELMADSSENFSLEEFSENSTLLNESARNINKLLENLLDWAQLQKGSINFTPKDSDLFKMVLQSIETIYQRALQKGIEIINEVDDTQKVYADEKMIGTVLRNLLSNAVKFTRQGGKTLVKSKLSDNDMIEISVEDNGVGITEKDVKRLFKIEEKVSSVGTDGESSTGLGLLLCKEFIEKNGGKIWVESELGKGSKFKFTLRSSNTVCPEELISASENLDK